jgi:predicted DNA-binding protein
VASTSVHLPAKLIERLDQLARESGRSRNSLIRQALEAYASRARESWPEDFLSADRLPEGDVRDLQDSLEDWLVTLRSSRRNRSRGPF